MSISMKSTKAQMYSEIERLRALNDRLDQQLRASQRDITAPRGQETKRPGTDVPKPRRSYASVREVPRPLLAAFTRRYCRDHGVRSVPADAVRAHFLGE